MISRIAEVARDGLVLDVLDEGPLVADDPGDAVVLLHGFPERATSWRDVAPLLHAAGMRTLAVDQRGYAPRARPPRRRDYVATELAADALAVVEAVRAQGVRRVHLAGHDWGAAVAWAAAVLAPHLVTSLTALSVPHPGAFARSWFTSRQGLASWYMLLFNVPGLAERLAREPGGRFDRQLLAAGMTPAEVDRFRREIVDAGALPGGLAWYRAIALTPPALLNRHVKVPTTMVWGRHDAAVTWAPVKRTRRYVDADYDLQVILDAGHWIPTQAAGFVADRIIERVRSVT
ncbi:alpha/beta fold hydrolase [Nocardioides acrostichi]|uniref:Alpha/beta fold hydrolase n=1 Tax=Nocardioides acrostichi TaxID=2784339 RepID=A0A930UXS7_9ACTN|nr:alpha/beta fold hydrolase [Nocardioides acrostichi]MBF4161637.1 alpha/beta fold hydrolase [Nocardioides acrostichi]